MKKIFYVLPIYLLILVNIFAQEKITIDEALAIKIETPNRHSLSQQDPIEYSIVTDSWKRPKVGQHLNDNDTLSKWVSINTNNNGWFNDENLKGGYLYYNYNSTSDKIMLLEAHNYYNVFVNGEPRIGNVYGNKVNYEVWEPNFIYSYLPVKIKKGNNNFLFQVNNGNMKAVLHEIKADAFFNVYDNTLPDLMKNESYNKFGGIVVINAKDQILKNAKIKVISSDGTETITNVPQIIPISIRKVRFNFRGKTLNSNEEKIKVQLIINDKIIDEQTITLRCLDDKAAYKETFVSSIDGSVQYYAVNPSLSKDENQALFLSLHGARVEAINQAGSYANKTWGNIVSPTNRRPYGFNWESVGTLDALEVLEIAKRKFNPDKNRIYLTGHSMGGHGTWYIGANFSDQFASIAPSAGWISLWSYRASNLFNDFTKSQKLFVKAAKQSDTYSLAPNYSTLGIYILHGYADSVVSPTQPKSMINTLKNFHKDYDFHFEPNMEHWWDIDETKPGTDCTDWTPIFDFFARHSRHLDRIREINFTTFNPGISSKKYWVEVLQQNKLFEQSNIKAEYIPTTKLFRVKTNNIKTFSLDAKELNLNDNAKIKIIVDADTLNVSTKNNKVYLSNAASNWEVVDKFNFAEKNPNRYGSFKDLFKNNLVMVYGTNGTKEENRDILAKVRYDSEMMWYIGNFSFEIITDKEFEPKNYSDNNILFYGNENQNSAIKKLQNNLPVKVNNNFVKIGEDILRGKNLALYFIYPKNETGNNLIGIIAGTGSIGNKLTFLRPFLKPRAAFPDVTIFNEEILQGNNTGLKAVGFFGLDWSVANGEFIIEN